jgi:hypothetical protein
VCLLQITAALETAGYGLRYGIIKGPASYNMYIVSHIHRHGSSIDQAAATLGFKSR